MSDLFELPKAYDPSSVEDGLYARWEASGFFNPDMLPERNQHGEPYAIMMPPPNRTGILHMGSATMLALEDLMIRFERMRGKKTVWIPGTDHAAIATQVKVEQLLIKQGMKDPRRELGREKFLERVVEYADSSAETIRLQVRKMGSSCDWSRECYTFDDARNRAVNTLFKMMYDDGIIERGERLVNWDPQFKTVISDDEIEWKEETIPFYTFKYGPFEIGTARPETKFGDKYVVVHPEDVRYAEFKDGQKIELEWINGPITATVIKDAIIDREFGTGAMTITPWHDMIDYELAERRGLDKEQIIDLEGKLLPIAGEEFAGLSILEARKKVVEKLQAKGLIVNVDEKYVHRVAIAQRGGEMIEPQILRQWFVRVNKTFAVRQDTLGRWKKGEQVTLKELMQEAVRSGQTVINPERFHKIYFHWIDNLRDWCISRQIWFGHRIPVWYHTASSDEVQMVCSLESPGEGWEQDQDTLDTWFSSGSWTFSTLGWPDQTSDLNTFHPTAVLETGHDIIFFWVARMILMSTYALGEIPFKNVYLHGLVRDEQGRKISKSLGNNIDPQDMIAKYGTDAIRLSLLVGSAPGQDTRLSEAKIEGFRNFTNKLWNIARFMLMQLAEPSSDNGPVSLADEWILARLQQTIQDVTKKFEAYEFSTAAELLRDFTWNDVADWYLEIAKVEKNKHAILGQLLQSLLKMWHPFMPFVTEELWQRAKFDGLLMVAEWPSATVQEAPSSLFNSLRQLVTDMRRLRLEKNVDATKKVIFAIASDDARQLELVRGQSAWMERLTNAQELQFIDTLPTDWPTVISGSLSVALDLSGAIDVEAEQARLQKEIESTQAYVSSLESRLANQEFISKAPAKVVDDMRAKLSEAQAKLAQLDGRIKND